MKTLLVVLVCLATSCAVKRYEEPSYYKLLNIRIELAPPDEPLVQGDARLLELRLTNHGDEFANICVKAEQAIYLLGSETAGSLSTVRLHDYSCVETVGLEPGQTDSVKRVFDIPEVGEGTAWIQLSLALGLVEECSGELSCFTWKMESVWTQVDVMR